MQFTPQEMKLIERLRKQERQWRWLRWMLIALSLLIVCCYSYIGVSLCHRLHWEALTTEDVFVVAIYWPKMMVAMGFAAWFVIWPLTSWRGNATRLLLLKLLDAQSQKIGNENAG